MADIKTFSNSDDFWAMVETVSDWPERLAMSGGSAANFLDHVFVPDTAEIFLADERCVPTYHKDSNAHLVRKKLIEKHYIDRLDFYKPGMSANECAAEYELELKTEALFLFDLVVLGVGPDGHTASLFPNAPALNEHQSLCVATQASSEFKVKDRLSLTFAALKQAKTVLVLLQGAGKQEIFNTITDPNSNPSDYPARTLLDWPQAHIYWLNN